jgi:hypothetical protein
MRLKTSVETDFILFYFSFAANLFQVWNQYLEITFTRVGTKREIRALKKIN